MTKTYLIVHVILAPTRGYKGIFSLLRTQRNGIGGIFNFKKLGIFGFSDESNQEITARFQRQSLRARYYCVVTADFLTEDSYLGNIREPLTLNRYNYCVGNPVNYADSSGNISVMPVFAPAGVQFLYDEVQVLQDYGFPSENDCEKIQNFCERFQKDWETGLKSTKSSGLEVLSSLETTVYNMGWPVWIGEEYLYWPE